MVDELNVAIIVETSNSYARDILGALLGSTLALLLSRQFRMACRNWRSQGAFFLLTIFPCLEAAKPITAPWPR